MSTGYSGTPLPRKLGFVPGRTAAIIDAPPGWVDANLPSLPGVSLTTLRTRVIELIVLFVPDVAALKKRMPLALRHLDPAGALWVCWPKRASGVRTDMTEDKVREHCLPLGVVDTKVAALDEVWSGLKLMVRKDNRIGWPDPLTSSSD